MKEKTYKGRKLRRKIAEQTAYWNMRRNLLIAELGIWKEKE